MADHILQLDGAGCEESAPGDDGRACMPAAGAAAPPPWPVGQLRDYVAWARTTFTPTVTPAARAVLLAYYQRQRAAASYDGRAGQDRVTVRLLEGLVRLSQAHARLLARHTVGEQDACAVLLLMQRCANTAPVLGGGGGGTAALCTCELDDAAHAAAARRLMDSLGMDDGPGRGASVWDASLEAAKEEYACAKPESAKWSCDGGGAGKVKGLWDQPGKRAATAAAGATTASCKVAKCMPPPPPRAPSAPVGHSTTARRPGWASAAVTPPHAQQPKVPPFHTVATGEGMPGGGGGCVVVARSGSVEGCTGADRTAHGMHVRTAGAVSGFAAPCVPGDPASRRPRWPAVQHAASAPASGAGAAEQQRCRPGALGPVHEPHALDLLHANRSAAPPMGSLVGSAGPCGGNSAPLREIQPAVQPLHGGRLKAAAVARPRPHATSAPVFHFHEADEEIDLSDIL